MEAFKGAIDDAQDQDEIRVINWFGPGGYGKSTLRRNLTDIAIEVHRSTVCSIDFEHYGHRPSYDWMIYIREQLGKYKTIDFSTFDFVFARHFMLSRPDEDIRDSYPGIFRNGNSPIIEDVFSWADEGLGLLIGTASTAIPGLNLLYKYGSRLRGTLATWWNSRSVREQLSGIEDVEISVLERALPDFLAYDISRSQSCADKPRVVFLFDAHERIAVGGRTLQGEPHDRWLRDFVKKLFGCLIVIFGRESLRWTNDQIGTSTTVTALPLPELNEDASVELLEHYGVKHPKIQRQILWSCRGIPFALVVASEHYLSLREPEQREIPSPDIFGEAPEEVFERFLSHLSEFAINEIRLASYPRLFDKQMFIELYSEFFGGSALPDWDRLSRSALLAKSARGAFTMMPVLKKELQQRENELNPEVFWEIHEYIAKLAQGKAEAVWKRGDLFRAIALIKSEMDAFPTNLREKKRITYLDLALAKAEMARGNFMTSRVTLDKIISAEFASNEVNTGDLYCKAITYLGVLKVLMGEYTAGDRLLEKVQVSEELRTPLSGQMFSAIWRAKVQTLTGQRCEAENSLRCVAKKAERIGSWSLVARSKIFYATSKFQGDGFEPALAEFQLAKEAAEKVGRTDLSIEADIGRAQCLLILEGPHPARHLAIRSLALTKRGGLRPLQIDALIVYADCLSIQDDRKNALRMLQEALSRAKAMGYATASVRIMNRLNQLSRN